MRGDIPFDEPRREEAEAFAAKVKTEEDMLAPRMKEILCTHLHGESWLTESERSQNYGDRPFDLVAGREKDRKMVGFEVKSDHDRYDRLPAQLNSYLFLFDEVFLVLHKKTAPEWLPSEVGIIRVSQTGTAIIEKGSWVRSYFDISTGWDWTWILERNGIGAYKDRVMTYFHTIEAVRKNVLFNRFFSTTSAGKEKDRFYPLAESQVDLIVGFCVPENLKSIDKDIKKIEARLEAIKRIAKIGVEGTAPATLNGLDNWTKE